jgi:serralysin
MAGFRDVPGSGYGNPYIDSLIWGGKVWDVSREPIYVALADDFDYDEALQVHGPLTNGWMSDEFFIGTWWDEFVGVVVDALDLYSSVSNIKFQQAQTISQANIVWWMYPLDHGVSGWHETPATNNPSHQRWGLFHSLFPEVLSEREFGGEFRATVIHEIGHGLGLAHPHDGGGREDGTTFPGVNGKNELGQNNLNQSVYTTMSYNGGLNTVASGGLKYGNQGGLGAFDIAAIQVLYGANMTTATGNNVYTLPTKNDRGTGWASIWDAGGNDTISGVGSTAPVTIDLRAATLQPGDPNAGGYISQQNAIAGGFTIARGVVIENAVGSAHGDMLIGNAAANMLDGGAGNDTYFVDSPNDEVRDASGVDTVYATFNFSNPAIENVFVNGVQVKAGGLAVENGLRLLKGGRSKDVLMGSEANDRIAGGLGKDVLTGGVGQDIFVFDTKPSKANTDTITDYVVADDTIYIDNNYLKKVGKKGSATKPEVLSKKFFTVGSKAKDKDDYLVYDKKIGLLSYDEDGSGAKAAIPLVKLSKSPKGFSASEFLVI